MVGSFLKSIIVASLIATSTLAFAAGAPTCDVFFKLKPGFDAAENGRLTLRLGESKHKIVEATLNGIAQLLLGRALKLEELSLVTRRLLEDKSEDPYFAKLAKAFDLTVKVDYQTEFSKMIPKTGPVLVLMNHPANGRETIATAAAISMLRPDMKVALTFLLKDYPGMGDNAIFLNPSQSPAAKLYNKGQREQMDQWLKSGGVLLVHPSGEVSSYRYAQDKNYPKDPRWRIGVAKLIEDNPEVQIVPVFLDGQASETFQKVKTAKPYSLGVFVAPIFHIRELAIGQNAVFPINLGHVIKGTDVLKMFGGKLLEMMQYLRARTYALKGRFERNFEPQLLEPLVRRGDPQFIRTEISRMQLLSQEQGLQVGMAQGKDIPNILRELGRLNNDTLDLSSHHVVMFNPDTNVIVGAYRIAFNELQNTIEIGRPFINTELIEHDRALANQLIPLMLKALGKVLMQNPKYTRLLGHVSFSNQYSDISKAIMMRYLTERLGAPMRTEVTARNTFNPQSSVLPEALSLVPHISSLKELNALITEIDGVGLPGLIGYYDKLGARYLGFNFNPVSNSLDGLVEVNLLTADRTELSKYFGVAGLQNDLNSDRH